MSDSDPQTRDLRAALRPSDSRARKETTNIPPLVWIVVAVLIVIGVVAYFGWGRTLVSPTGAKVPAASASTATPAPAG